MNLQSLQTDWEQFRRDFVSSRFTSCGYAGSDGIDRNVPSSITRKRTESSISNNNENNEHQKEEKEEHGDDDVDDEEDDQTWIPIINTRREDNQLQLSTKSNVLKLHIEHIDYQELFWRTPVMPYMLPKEGIVRKEMMITLTSEEKANEYFQRRDNYVSRCTNELVSERVLPLQRGLGNNLKPSPTPSITNQLFFPPFEIGFRGNHDARSLHVGVCQKEIECKKREERKAFPNCFVFYLRWSRNQGLTFEESHIKIFSTGNIDMPGINDPHLLMHVKQLIQQLVFPPTTLTSLGLQNTALSDSSSFWEIIQQAKVVLVNAEFQCNFTIDNVKLRDLFISSFGIKSELKNETPGLKCSLFVRRNLPLSSAAQSFKLDPEDEFNTKRSNCMKEKYFKITYTFFQSGEVLVSGACPETIIHFSFEFIRNVLLQNWKLIRSFIPRGHTKKAKKLRYVSKCKYTVRYDHLLETILDPTDWRCV